MATTNKASPSGFGGTGLGLALTRRFCQMTERSGVMSNAFHNAMPKILLVEDNEMNRDMLSRRLERKGYQVALAVDGQSGVELAQEDRIGAIRLPWRRIFPQ